MQITSIKLRDFRNYEELTLAPHPGVNILFGQNGSGKTNLLEAIHYCALGRSHRTSLDREVVRKDRPMAAVGVQLKKNGVRTDVAVRLTPQDARRKTVFIDNKRAPRLSDLMGRVQCVIFSPEDLMLVKEGPSIRRRFLDMMLSQLSTAYFVALQQYQKALDQRNAMLRSARRGERIDTGMLDAFEEAMAIPCETIIPLRRRFVALTDEIASMKYASVSGREAEIFTMSYQCCLPEDDGMAQKIRKCLRESRKEDIQRGSTGLGIHREDIALTLSGREMKVFASQGQIRTAALSMKLAQLEIFQRESGESPILLLDDVMSELDMTRRTRLLDEISGVQTFITCTDESDLEGCREKRSYRVSLCGEGMARVMESTAGESVNENAPFDDLDLG
ncbi:MAG: DNA replication/repair protein RecF [Christensenellaceae bacterium]|nr:DNA replication/repair protein RecF [Christensenellaceae bacterium]